MQQLQQQPQQPQPGPPAATGYRVVSNVKQDEIPKELRKDCVLFYTEDFKDLAERIAATSQGHIQLGRIRWKWVHAAACSRAHVLVLPSTQRCQRALRGHAHTGSRHAQHDS